MYRVWFEDLQKRLSPFERELGTTYFALSAAMPTEISCSKSMRKLPT